MREEFKRAAHRRAVGRSAEADAYCFRARRTIAALGHQMPWTPNDAEKHTHKATTPPLQQLWRKSPTKPWNAPAMKVARSGKQMLWSRGKPILAVSFFATG
jgi:hypothetical protein